MVEVICDNCGKNIKLKGKSYIKKHNFCNRKCYGEFRKKYYVGSNVYSYKERKVYYCKNCNKEILSLDCVMKNKKNIFCSRECRNEYDSKIFKGNGNPNYKNGDIEIKCLYCGKSFERPYAQKDRAKYCSKECKNKHWSEVLSKTPENQERLRQQGINAMKKSKNKFTKPEKVVYEYLQDNNIICIPQYPMYNRFVVDFYIPSLDIVIEVLGDYWHGNPLKYPKEKLTERQLKHQQKDKIKMEYLTNNNHKVYMIWENDIYKDIVKTMNFLNI